MKRNWQLDSTSIHGISLWENDERSNGNLIASIFDNSKAELILEAGTVLNETGKTPKQLAEVIKENEVAFDALNADRKQLAEALDFSRSLHAISLQRGLDLKESNAELLEALKRLYNSVDGCVDLTPDVLAKAKLAINKASLTK